MTKNDHPRFFILPLQIERVSAISMILCAMDPWLSMGYTPEAFDHYLLREDPALSRCLIMVSRDIAGILTIRSPWLFGPFIELLAVFEGFQGKRIGSSVIDWICEQHKPENLWATVASFNVRAQKFYMNSGFEQKAVLENLIKPGWNEILLRKRLKVEDSG